MFSAMLLRCCPRYAFRYRVCLLRHAAADFFFCRQIRCRAFRATRSLLIRAAHYDCFDVDTLLLRVIIMLILP